MSYPEEITRETEAQFKAQTIIKQIPAMTRMACGWRNASYSANDEAYDVQVTATVLRGNSHFIRVTLELNDTYTVERLRIPTARAKDQSIRHEERAENVFCDMLGEVVYKMCNK